MSGSGDLEVMRLVKKLRVRVTTPEVTYGSHMAIHMSLGLLFLGGGRYVHTYVCIIPVRADPGEGFWGLVHIRKPKDC